MGCPAFSKATAASLTVSASFASEAVVVSGQFGGTSGRQRPSVATCATVTREAGGDQGRWLFGHSDAPIPTDKAAFGCVSASRRVDSHTDGACANIVTTGC